MRRNGLCSLSLSYFKWGFVVKWLTCEQANQGADRVKTAAIYAISAAVFIAIFVAFIGRTSGLPNPTPKAGRSVITPVTATKKGSLSGNAYVTLGRG